MSGPGPREAAALFSDAVVSVPADEAEAVSTEDVGAVASNGAEAAAVAGDGFSAIRSLVQNEDRIMEEMLKRTNGNGSVLPTSKDIGDSRGPYRYNGTPMVITTEAFASQGRYILFWSGPSNTSWKFELRASQEQTRSGTIYHYWRNGSRATLFDEPSVSFTFQTGNIMPVRFRPTSSEDDSPLAVFLPPGLLDYYEFFDMLNQPKILPDGRPNFVFISYHSLVYPEIFLRGFFEPSGLSITEDASNPTSITWTSSFKIRSTEPPFWSAAQLVNSWNSAMGAQSFESAVQDIVSSSSSPGPVTGQGPQG